MGHQPTYRLYAIFDNIGGLKIRSPVKIGGVVVGHKHERQIGSLPRQLFLDRHRSFADGCFGLGFLITGTGKFHHAAFCDSDQDAVWPHSDRDREQVQASGTES